VFFRNDWSWDNKPDAERPLATEITTISKTSPTSTIELSHPEMKDKMYFHINESPGASGPPNARGEYAFEEGEGMVEDVVTPEVIFTENETNFERLYGGRNANEWGCAKDGFHDYIIRNYREDGVFKKKVDRVRMKLAGVEEVESDKEVEVIEIDEQVGSDEDEDGLKSGQRTPTAEHHPVVSPYSSNSLPISPEQKGTKAAGHFVFNSVPPNGGCCVVRLKLSKKKMEEDPSIADDELFDQTIEERKYESDEFYLRFNSGPITEDLRNIMRQGLAGMLWSKQFYMFHHKEWIEGDSGQPKPPDGRKYVRNGVSYSHLRIKSDSNE
jgi:hypothetical protein